MKPLRVAIVMRRFWPLTGRTGKSPGQPGGRTVPPRSFGDDPHRPLAAGLAGGIALSRSAGLSAFARRRRAAGTTLQYMRSLARWLRSHADRFDLVYVSQLRHEAYAALRAVGGGCRWSCGPNTSDASGDCLWQLDAPCGRRIKRQCMEAAALVAPTPRRAAGTRGRRISPPADRIASQRRAHSAAADAAVAGRRPRAAGRNASSRCGCPRGPGWPCASAGCKRATAWKVC